MRLNHCLFRAFPLAVACLTSLPLHAVDASGVDEEVVVTASRGDIALLDLIGNTAKLDQERIRITNDQHIYELGVAVAGTWLSRGSGQENLTAIRSPVLTGPGACGAFLILENGIPIRPTGFCNVNELFEVPSELAGAVEVIRGPSNALYGSNGLHGTMNILLPQPGSAPGWNGSGTVGADEYYRGKLGWDGSVGEGDLNFGVLADHYDGFRASSGYTQQKGFVQWDQPLDNSTLGWALSAQNLDQQTAGFIQGQDAYKDPSLRTTNPNPDAFRKANSQRLSARWTPDASHAWSGADFRFYLRRSDMEFLMHFLPGQPLEENGQQSGGMIFNLQRPWGATTVTAGLDLEYMDAFIKQFQAEPVTVPPFLAGKLPQGWQYDFDVSSIMAAPYAQIDVPINTDWNFQAGIRVEYLRYDYDNNMLDGNTQDDGVPCPDGCRYRRPADRTDDFWNVAPNIGIAYRINPETTWFTTLARGFRAPQATELYRLQEGQQVADLDTVTIDSLESGVHWQTGTYQIEAVGFAMYKRNYIFQDTDRNNISDGKTKHLGLEVQADARYASGVYVGLAATWVRHTYAFDQAARGETIVDGNDVDTAPRTLASLRLGWEQAWGLLELEGIHQGSYYLDAANLHKYDGHDLLNARAVWRVSDAWSVTGRVNNITDDLYADRADFAFGNYRYFPGREREFFVEVAFRTY